MFLVLLAAALSCADEPAHPPLEPDPPAWSQIAGGVGDGFRAAWGTHADSLLAIGIDRTLLRGRGGAWNAEGLPDGVAALRSISGRNAGDVFAVGENGVVVRFDGTSWAVIPSGTPANLNDVWCAPGSTVAAAATDPASGAGRVLRFDGTAWSVMAGRFDSGLNAVWALDAQTIFVAGEDGYAARFDNRGWSPLVAFTTDYAWLDAWGAGATEVFFAGEGGRVGHYRNGALTVSATPVTAALHAIWGFAADDVWAAGDDGALVHFDGTAWSAVVSGTTSSLRALCGFGDGRAVALGDFGTVLAMENDSWRVARDGRPIRWNRLVCFSPHEAIVVGRRAAIDGVIRHIDGREWTFPGEEVRGVFGASPDDVYAVGRAGSIRRFDGNEWTSQPSGTFETLFGVTTAARGATRVYVVGDRGTIRYWNGVRWGPMVPPGNAVVPVYDAWAAADDDVFAVGAQGTVLRYRGPLASLQWSAETTGIPATVDVTAVGGRGPSDVVVVTADGRLFRYNGRAWRPMPGGTRDPLLDVTLVGRGDGYALAAPRTLLRLGAGRWHAGAIPFLGEMRTLDAVEGAGFAAGTNGAVFQLRF